MPSPRLSKSSTPYSLERQPGADERQVELKSDHENGDRKRGQTDGDRQRHDNRHALAGETREQRRDEERRDNAEATDGQTEEDEGDRDEHHAAPRERAETSFALGHEAARDDDGAEQCERAAQDQREEAGAHLEGRAHLVRQRRERKE